MIQKKIKLREPMIMASQLGKACLPLVLFLSFIALMPIQQAAAQQVEAEEIVRGLLPKEAPPSDRSWGAAKKTRAFDARKRGINVKGALPKDLDLPSVSMTVNFEYDSARLTNDGILALYALADALRDRRLQGMQFQIAGHTDGRGSYGYNQGLSERRAITVVEHLTNYHDISRQRLIAIGYGETRLLNEAYPEDSINRRVEIINVAPLF